MRLPTKYNSWGWFRVVSYLFQSWSGTYSWLFPNREYFRLSTNVIVGSWWKLLVIFYGADLGRIVGPFEIEDFHLRIAGEYSSWSWLIDVSYLFRPGYGTYSWLLTWPEDLRSPFGMCWSMREHVCLACVRMRPHASACVVACVRMRPHASACVRMRPHA